MLSDLGCVSVPVNEATRAIESLAAGTRDATESLAHFQSLVRLVIEEAVGAMSPAQQAIYRKLEASGIGIFDALRAARRM